jgi:ankyrin repeat protein
LKPKTAIPTFRTAPTISYIINFFWELLSQIEESSFDIAIACIMSQTTELQNLTRCLLAAGYAKSQEGKEQYILYVDPEGSFLQLQQWSGNSVTNQELIVDSVRPKSTAACLITPIDKLIISISPSSSLDAYTYDEEEHEWVQFDESDIGGLSRCVVHPDGKLASSVDAKGIVHVVFQDQSGRLVYFYNGSNTILPVNPLAGSPLSMSTIRNRMHIFYISAKDNAIHDVTRANHSWQDTIVVQHTFYTKPKSFMVTENESKETEVYVMTDDNTLLKSNAEGRLTKLGTVKMGKFVFGRSVDLCTKDAWNGALTEDNLKSYLADDPSCIDIPGSEYSVTPLAAACITGQLDVVRLLLRYRANPNALSPKRRTPLFYTTSTSEGRDRCAIVLSLLKAGANVDECYAENGYITPLMNAITLPSDQDVVEELLNHGASTIAKDIVGHTAAILAKGTPMEATVSKRLERAKSDGHTMVSPTSAKGAPREFAPMLSHRQPSSTPASPEHTIPMLAEGAPMGPVVSERLDQASMVGYTNRAPTKGAPVVVEGLDQASYTNRAPVVFERQPSSVPVSLVKRTIATLTPETARMSERLDQASSVGHNKAPMSPVLSEQQPPSVPVSLRHTRTTLAQGVPVEAVVSERLDQANLSPVEGQIIEFVVALLVFIIAYTNSPRVKRLVDQVVIGLASEINDANDKRHLPVLYCLGETNLEHTSRPRALHCRTTQPGASLVRRRGGSADGWNVTAASRYLPRP